MLRHSGQALPCQAHPAGGRGRAGLDDRVAAPAGRTAEQRGQGRQAGQGGLDIRTGTAGQQGWTAGQD